MLTDKIRPIPKYIIERIRKRDEKDNIQNGYTRYYSYLTKVSGELAKITIAVRNKYSKWYCKQVAVHAVHADKCMVKDMEYSYFGGYYVGWYSEGLTKYPKWYESDDWWLADDKYFNVYAPVVNMEYLNKYPEYKYAAWDNCGMEIISYLKLYEKYPQVEYLVKAGLQCIETSKPILRKIATDKQFCKWLMRNKERLQTKHYYKDVIMRAYTSGKDLDILQKEKKFKLKLAHDDVYKTMVKPLDKDEVAKLNKYLYSHDINVSSYRDYIYACKQLELDVSEEKNKYPQDFKFWHDVRIREYELKLIELDEQKNKEFYKCFAEVANRYIQLEKQDKEYAIIIAKSPKELKLEGQALDHCVGRMGYDKKVVDGNSLIFFVRDIRTIDTPLVTVEYSPKQHKVLQCYGYRDTKPEQKILDFVDNNWLPYANKQIQKMQRASA